MRQLHEERPLVKSITLGEQATEQIGVTILVQLKTNEKSYADNILQLLVSLAAPP
jgi:hypothetical protein